MAEGPEESVVERRPQQPEHVRHDRSRDDQPQNGRQHRRGQDFQPDDSSESQAHAGVRHAAPGLQPARFVYQFCEQLIHGRAIDGSWL